MKRATKRAMILSAVAGATAVSMMASVAKAQTAYTWSAGGGTQNWTTGWGAGYPNTGADTATISGALGSNLNINLDATNVTAGVLTLDNTSGSIDVGNANSTANPFNLNNTAGTVTQTGTLTSAGAATNIISAPLYLHSNVNLIATSTRGLTISGPIYSVGGNREIRNQIPGAAGSLTISGALQLWDPINVDMTSGLNLARSAILNIDNGSVNVINGQIVAGDGVVQQSTGSLTIRGASTSAGHIHTAVLNSNNISYAGTIALNEATLVVGHDNALGNGSFANNVLRLGTGSNSRWLTHLQSDNDARHITVGALWHQGGQMVYSGDHSLTVTTEMFQSNSRPLFNVLPAGKTLTLNGVISVWNAPDTGRQWTFDGSGETVVNSLIRNDNDYTNRNDPQLWNPDTSIASIFKRGTGTVTLNSTSSTWRGNTTVEGGLLVFGANNTWGNTGEGAPGIVVNPNGAVAYAPGVADANFGNFAAEISTASTGALAIGAADAAANLDFTTLGGAGNVANMSLGSQAAALTYTGTITPANSKYRIGGGLASNPTITLPNANQLTGANAVDYANGGTVIVGANQDYTGATTITGANMTTNQLRAQTRNLTTATTIFVPMTLQIGSIANGGVASPLGASSNAASNLVINGGILKYTGNGSTDRLFSVGASGATIESAGTGPLDFTNTGANDTIGTGARSLTVTGASGGSIAGTLGNGTGTLHLVKSGAGTWSLTGANTYTGATTVNAGILNIGQSSRTSSSLVVANGAKAAMTPRTGVPDLASSRKTLQVGTLNLNTSGTLDMADNDLVVDAGSFTAIQAAVLAGFGTTGPGIISSTSDGTQIHALFDNALVGAADWNGGTIGANAIVGKYTYFGDVNIDGQVTGDDYTIIDSNLDTDPAVGIEWLSGDANLDGIVTGDDYTIIDSNLGLGSGNPLTPSSLSAVPEPGSLVALGAAAGLLLGARRRRRNTP